MVSLIKTHKRIIEQGCARPGN